jgi:imidazolonepropionase-like amidohydrolase
MKRKFLFNILLLAASFTTVLSQPKLVAIKCGTLIDVKNSKAITNATILVEGNRIKSVGKLLELPPDADVIDLSNATVLPGLFDLHCHFLDNIEGGNTRFLCG